MLTKKSDKWVPIVDFGPAMESGQGNLQRVARQVSTACETSGFFYIVNHPISAALIDRVFIQAKKFFALPHAVKSQVSMLRSDNFRGYIP